MNQSPYYLQLQIREALYVGSNDELYPLFSGYQNCPPCHHVETLRDHYLLCCVNSGRGVITYGSPSDCGAENTYHVSPGETFLITPGCLTSYSSDENDPWSYAWIAFSGGSAGKYLGSTDFSRTPVVKTGTDIYCSIREITETAFSLKDSGTRYLYASAVLWTMLADLMQRSDGCGAESTMNNYTERAIGIIRRGYHMQLNVSDIAAELKISREYFYTLFKNDTGKSPSQYLLDFRMERACAMLRESDYPIALIAQHSGFSDKAYFSRKFHEQLGISPTAYRKSMKGKQT